MKRQRAIMRDCPWRGCPDHCGNVRADFRGVARAAANNLEGNPDRWAGVVLVLDFGFRKRSIVVNAPVHRLAPAVHVALLHEFEERASDGGFVLVAHGQVRVVPATKDTKALEVALVLLDESRAIFAATLAKLRWRYFAFAAKFLFH